MTWSDLESESWGSPQGIRYQLCPSRQHRLPPVGSGSASAKDGEALRYLSHSGRMELKGSCEGQGRRLSGQVIVGRAQPTRADDHFGALCCPLKGSGDLLNAVACGDHAAHPQPEIRETRAEEVGVGVGHQAGKNLLALADDEGSGC